MGGESATRNYPKQNREAGRCLPQQRQQSFDLFLRRLFDHQHVCTKSVYQAPTCWKMKAN